MKRNLVLSIALFALFLSSCNHDELECSDIQSEFKTAKKGLDAVNNSIYSLDFVYRGDASLLSNRQIRKIPGGDTLELIKAYDMSGASIGWAGSWFIYNPALRLLAAAVVGGVASYAKYLDYTNGMSISDMHNTSLSHLNNFRNLDLRQPINHYAPTQLYNTDVIGKNVGPIHNRLIINAYMTNGLNPNLVIDDETLFNMVSNEHTNPLHLQYSDIADLMHEAHHMSDTQLIASLNAQFYDELHIINHVYEVSLNLDSVSLLAYTNQVMEIVNDAYSHSLISDNSAYMINASVSTLAHTRLLWKSYLPDYRLNNLFMCYLAENRKWVLCNRSQLASLCSNNYVPYVGIPGIVDGRCSEIFFYPSHTLFYGANNPHYSQLSTETNLEITNETSFDKMINIYGNSFFDKMLINEYHIREVPNEDHIYYVSFDEP